MEQNYHNKGNLDGSMGRQEVREKLRGTSADRLLMDHTLSDSDRKAIKDEAGLNKSSGFDMTGSAGGGGGIIVIGVLVYLYFNGEIVKNFLIGAIAVIVVLLIVYFSIKSAHKATRTPQRTDVDFKIKKTTWTRKDVEREVGKENADLEILLHKNLAQGLDLHFEALNNILDRQSDRVREIFEKDYPVGKDIAGFEDYIEFGPATEHWFWGEKWSDLSRSLKLLYQLNKSAALLHEIYIGAPEEFGDQPKLWDLTFELNGVRKDDVTSEFKEMLAELHEFYAQQKTFAQDERDGWYD